MRLGAQEVVVINLLLFLGSSYLFKTQEPATMTIDHLLYERGNYPHQNLEQTVKSALAFTLFVDLLLAGIAALSNLNSTPNPPIRRNPATIYGARDNQRGIELRQALSDTLSDSSTNKHESGL